MGRRRDKLGQTTFRCGCGYLFDAEPTRIEDAPETPWHPWEYFATCPSCDAEAPQQGQARHLLKMWAKATGPKTAEGKAAVTRNLEGHPTPEEAIRTRFNAMKHGMNAEVATYFPAKPGGYAQCDGCQYLMRCFPGEACQKRTELFLRHRIAFDTRDPSLLTELRADLHATLCAIVQDMLLSVLQDGARIKAPAWYYDKDGGFHLARFATSSDGRPLDGVDADDADGLDESHFTQLYEIKEHPLLKRIGDWVKSFGLDLNSQGMTPKVVEDEDTIRGHLAGHAQNETLALDYQRRGAEAIEGLRELILRARDRTARDPVLLQHHQASDDADAG